MFATITLYQLALWVHISAVITAFGALFAYPIFLAVNARAPIAERAQFHRLQIAFSKNVTGPTIVVVLLAGVYMASDAHLWSQAWVSVGFTLLIVIAGLGATVLRRAEVALVSTAEAGDESAYAIALKQANLWTSVTLVLIVVTIFFMAVKPFS